MTVYMICIHNAQTAYIHKQTCTYMYVRVHTCSESSDHVCAMYKHGMYNSHIYEHVDREIKTGTGTG